MLWDDVGLDFQRANAGRQLTLVQEDSGQLEVGLPSERAHQLSDLRLGPGPKVARRYMQDANWGMLRTHMVAIQ